MAKKVSFDNLPAMVGKMLEILTAEGSEHTATPEILQRVKLLEKKLDSIERLVSPDRPVMDKQMVLRLLKIRPKQLSELELTGVLTSHKEGRSAVFYEDDVMRCYAKQFAWRNAIEQAAKPVASESAEPTVPVEPVEPDAGKPDEPVVPIEPEPASAVSDEPVSKEDVHLIDIDAAAAMIGRSKYAVYNLTSKDRIPFMRKGNKLLFDVEVLEKWMADNSSGKGKSIRREPKETGAGTVEADGRRRVDIHEASKIVGRNPGAIYELNRGGKIPSHKEGQKVYFIAEELTEWVKTHPPRKYKRKNETETA